MKNITPDEKKEIKKDWKYLLSDYKSYKTFRFIKRNGPVLIGIYLNPSHGGSRYSPQLHTHLLLEPFPVIALGTLLPFCTSKGTEESISYRRHKNEFDKIALAFKEQFPEVFSQVISCKTLSNIFDKSISMPVGSPHFDMRDHVLLLYWCGNEYLVEKRIAEYKDIIKSWPNSRKAICNGEDGWEQDLRVKLNIDKLRRNVEDEIVKHKLTKYKDYGLLCD